MARKRGQQNGYLFVKGPSWFVRFYEYDREGNGKQKTERVGPARGPDRLSRREAKRKADEEFLGNVNRRNLRPSSSMPVQDFIESKFVPQVVEKKKHAGQQHYGYLLRAFVVPALGAMRLCDVSMDNVEALMAALRQKGYSHQTILHAKNCVHSVFRHARRLKLYFDENPAADLDMGEKPLSQRRHTYSWEQAALVLNRLPSPVKEMALLSMAASMNVAEMCGTREKRCNFTDQPIVVDGEMLAPYSIAVRENYYRNHWGSLKKGSRRRNVPLTPDLAEQLKKLLTGNPERPLFASRNGTPLDAHNIGSRVFRPLARRLGFPVEWHAFRRAHSSFGAQCTDVPLADRVATMGHADARMTLYYDIADVERRRKLPAEILERLGEYATDVPPITAIN